MNIINPTNTPTLYRLQNRNCEAVQIIVTEASEDETVTITVTVEDVTQENADLSETNETNGV